MIKFYLETESRTESSTQRIYEEVQRRYSVLRLVLLHRLKRRWCNISNRTIESMLCNLGVLNRRRGKGIWHTRLLCLRLTSAMAGRTDACFFLRETLISPASFVCVSSPRLRIYDVMRDLWGVCLQAWPSVFVSALRRFLLVFWRYPV